MVFWCHDKIYVPAMILHHQKREILLLKKVCCLLTIKTSISELLFLYYSSARSLLCWTLCKIAFSFTFPRHFPCQCINFLLAEQSNSLLFCLRTQTNFNRIFCDFILKFFTNKFNSFSFVKSNF